MSDHQVSTRKRKTSSEKKQLSPIEAAASFDTFDFTSSFCSSVAEETPPAKKHKYELRNRSRADATVTPTTVESSSAVVTSVDTIDPAHWIKGRGESGLKGVGHEPTTIKSKPWRAKFKSKQKRFATRAEAAEWFYKMNVKHNKK